MKKLLILLLFPFTSFSQDLVIKNGESKTIMNPISYGNITMEGNSSLTVLSNVYIGNLNLNGNNKITIYTEGKLSVSSSLNLNSSDTIINNGGIYCSAIEVQNINAYFKNTGKTETYNSDLQINNGVLENSGEIIVKNYLNLNNGKYITNLCGKITSYGLNINIPNSVSGVGSMFFNVVNANNILTQSSDIYVYYTGTRINNINNWGKARLNPPVGCNVPALPVKVVSTKFTKKGDGIDCYIEFTQESTQIGFIVQESEDGITWRSVIYPVKTTKDSNKYTYHYKPE